MRTLSFLLVAAMLCCIVPSVQADDGSFLTPAERVNIDTLLVKLNLPKDVDSAFRKLLRDEEPELEQATDKYYLNAYTGGDVLKSGLISVDRGHNTKVWTLSRFFRNSIFSNYNNYQLVYFVELGTLGFRMDPQSRFSWYIWPILCLAIGISLGRGILKK